MTLVLLSLAPVLLLMAYVYFRDKYEKEPVSLLLKGIVAGAVIILPVVFIEKVLMALAPGMSQVRRAAYDGFIVAGATEELFKFLALYLLFWRNRNFNERYDGIVYAVSISLGFAAVENVMYVYQGSIEVGVIRAFTAVPAHAVFGVVMGFYMGLAKFVPLQTTSNLLKAVAIPWLLHGIYDFLILSQQPFLLLLFIPFVFIMWRLGLKKMRQHIESSVFRNSPPPPPGPISNE